MKIKRALRGIIYFLLMKFSKKEGNSKVLLNTKKATSMEPFYSLQAVKNNGKAFPLLSLRGKKVLIVNTASECGYTPQYDELQKLYEEYKDKLEILGFPANDFGEQEKGSDEEIAKFCKINYGVSFPIMKKGTVIKTEAQNAVFKWLTNSKNNGWNDQAPVWNFCKYLVDENGALTAFFGPAVSPMSKEIIDAVTAK